MADVQQKWAHSQLWLAMLQKLLWVLAWLSFCWSFPFLREIFSNQHASQEHVFILFLFIVRIIQKSYWWQWHIIYFMQANYSKHAETKWVKKQKCATRRWHKIYFIRANHAKHAKTQWVSKLKCATCKHARSFFARTHRKQAVISLDHFTW